MVNKNRQDLIEYICNQLDGYTNEQIDKMSDHLLDDMLCLAMSGRPVHLTNLGQLKQVEKTARVGRNPKTGDLHTIRARKRIVFSFVKKLRKKEI
ncbi:HU family DNA-binding protein [Shewanella fidelis]|uniref:HU family DNA-binding protein n=1 Tax=Shewanella fidelis TaxID=173509 RepID=A0AAW8NN94_9GAMM|nr:HU family DNA-binding protein [Shewanella fidelis]MDR8523820.1 HU family DNA-binding protein [Shewanella fidelis]MDW4810368.1 HU family DNA-binding protein [Shewanella fidelis]MDW4814513.1 HU family DNA-binding protein [Shewanella fidelis]MDW4818603.1 HU family DNA-binding protein [Shewanella fidelis]MDW4823744.1 HU family DNA-binding protein [Shewanella fidelis]